MGRHTLNHMKQLIALISTGGKTSEEVSQQANEAIKKFNKVASEVQPTNQPETLIEKLKLLLSITPLVFLFSIFTGILLDMVDLDIGRNFWFIVLVWMLILWNYIKRDDGEKYFSRWNNVTRLWSFVGIAFIGSILTVFFLSLLLQWTLNINIQEMDKTINLTLVVWIIWVIGFHIYHKKTNG